MNSDTHRSGAENDELALVAAAWAEERRDGFAPGRAEAFSAWCEADPRHRAALARCEQALALLGRIQEIREPLEAATPPPAGRARGRGEMVRIWFGGLAAALAVGAGVWWWAGERPAGEQRIVAAEQRAHEQALADGSIVTVNAGGEMRVRLTEQSRRIVLEAGEAHFDVAPDPARPFVVEAAGVSVRAVGTAFNVVARPNRVEVIVSHGRVEVTRAGGEGATAGVSLDAGERASVDRDESGGTPQVEKLDPAALRAALAWRRQTVSFSDTPLREIVQRFNRSNVTQLVIADPELATRTLGGTFEIDQVEDFVRLLEQDGEIAVERRGAREIVLRRVTPSGR